MKHRKRVSGVAQWADGPGASGTCNRGNLNMFFLPRSFKGGRREMNVMFTIVKPTGELSGVPTTCGKSSVVGSRGSSTI